MTLMGVLIPVSLLRRVAARVTPDAPLAASGRVPAPPWSQEHPPTTQRSIGSSPITPAFHPEPKLLPAETPVLSAACGGFLGRRRNGGEIRPQTAADLPPFLR